MRIQNLLPFGALFASTALLACGSNTAGTGPSSVGGNSSTSTTSSSSTSTSTTSAGGSTSVGGTGQTSTTSNNTSAGGNTAVGGTSAGQGGTNSTTTTGTKAVGGATAAGGTSSTGTGTKATGGTSASVGGTSSTGTKAVGGSTGVGGTSGGAVGGNSSTSTKATGGTTTAGGATTNGGTTANGGTSAVAGSSSTVAGGSGTRPKGYWYLNDWKVSSPAWQGCVWTGIDTVSGTKTTIAPQDFMAVTDGGPYQVKGSVNGAYESVALLGFNLNEAIDGKADQCKYNAATATAEGPPSVSMSSITASKKGLAINWSATTKPAQFRVQLQAPDSATNLAHAWCATITDAQGPSFVKWSDFYAYCWDYPTPVDNYTAVQYKNEDIDAVSFLVPGVLTATPFDFTVTGFAPGDSAADAPGPAPECGKMTGTIGNGGPSEDASMQRAAVTDTNCKKYVVFNNNWGNPTGSSQVLDFTANKFTVKSSNGSGSGAPASFPSIYIGASGDLGGGTFNTWSDSGLPKKGSAITSANTTFTWTGNTGDYNAAYDIWFSDTSPTAGSYEDAIQGFLMVWLYKPSNQSPIGGSSKRSTGTIAGHKWDVWVGPRGNTSTGTKDANRPVISYVAQDGPVKSLTFNIKDFINDAVTNATTDKNNGGTSAAFSADWYLTDVFAGFEAWTASSIVGNTATMTCEIK